MLTIFSAPKPFLGHIKIIQENAIQSWKKLSSEFEVILLGRDEGVSEAARKFQCKHIGEIKYSDHGTPLVSGIFQAARSAASKPVLCYVNSDIIFTSSLVSSIKLLKGWKKFLLSGQRYDVNITEKLNFDSFDWEKRLSDFVKEFGVMHDAWAMDYFIFPVKMALNIPDFVVGRAGWDNWMIYNARRQFIPSIDGTKSILAVHQNHDYNHCAGSKEAAYVTGPEVKKNFMLMNRSERILSLYDTIWCLENDKVLIASERLGCHLRNIDSIYPCLGKPSQFLLKVANTNWLGRIAKKMFKRCVEIFSNYYSAA